MVARIRHKIAVFLVLFWTLAPLYWALNTSLQTDARAQSRPAHFIPNPVSTQNYEYLLGLQSGSASATVSAHLRRAIMNIFIEATGAMLIGTTLAVLAAYAFARIRFRLSQTLFYVLLGTMALPAYATLIPIYRAMSDLRLTNTYIGMIIVFLGGFLPLSIWILYNFFRSIPRELEEAAFVDGAGRMRTLQHVFLPVAVPGIVAVGIISWLSGYAAFLFPLVITTDLRTQPLTVIMASLVGQHTVPFTMLNAAGVMAIVPPVVLTLVLSRYIISGLLAGAIK